MMEYELTPREAYDSYLRIWHDEHRNDRDGKPVGFDEFMEDYYADSDYMRYLAERML